MQSCGPPGVGFETNAIGRRHNYVTALAGGKTEQKLEVANSKQHRFIYTRSLKHHFVVMLDARIDVVDVYLLPHKNPQQLWLNSIERADCTETIVKHDRACSAHLSEKVQ